jgi:hypothetical protein
MREVRIAGVTFADGGNTHLPHRRNEVNSAHLKSFQLEHIPQHWCTRKWMIQMQLG